MANQDEQDKKNKESLDRQRATRERRAEEKRVEDLKKQALDQTSGTKEGKEVQATDSAEQRAADRKSRLQESNRRQRAADTETYGEGSQLLESQEGNIYDVETGEYDPTFNKEGTDETISNDGIDQFGSDDDVDFSTSFTVTICVNGEPQQVSFLTA
tara:strand:+ start:13 stop:483 length:471 start_codon:yes stop_codon:yes gene_type:complete